MGINIYLLFGFLFSLLVVFYLAAKLHRVPVSYTHLTLPTT